MEIPPLRERRDDIPLLVERFRDVFAKEHDRAVTGVTPAAFAALVNYDWPGNVRELKNVVESSVLFASGSKIDVTDLPAPLRAQAGVLDAPAHAEASAGPHPEGIPAPPVGSSTAGLLGKTIAEIEKEAILLALQASGGTRRKAAERLDIGLRTLQRKLKEYRGGVASPDDDDEGDEENGEG